MASAIIWPICWSWFAEEAPTWAICLVSRTGVEMLPRWARTAATALSMPRLRRVGLAPGGGRCGGLLRRWLRRRPWRWCSRRRRRWEVLLGDFFDEPCASRFSWASSSSISLATVTPSLVTVGEPKDFSITTLRPEGPRVTLTAWARILTPRRIASRASVSNMMDLAAISGFSRRFGSSKVVSQRVTEAQRGRRRREVGS